MSMIMKTRRLTALDYWERKRVPPVQRKVIFYVLQCKKRHHVPTWKEIAQAVPELSGMTRACWRNVLLRSRKYGLAFEQDKPGTVRVIAPVREYVRANHPDMTT